MISQKWKRRTVLVAAFVLLFIAWQLVPYQDINYGEREAYKAMGVKCDICLDQAFHGQCSRWDCNETMVPLAKFRCSECVGMFVNLSGMVIQK
jgi:hypothetical protein